MKKADLGKLAQDVGDAYSDFSGKVQELDAKIDALVSAGGKWINALKQTAAIYQNDDFGLDEKADAQKIAKVRKCFNFVSQTATGYDDELSNYKKARTQYRAAMKTWL
jgi:hypothetical protein